MFNPLLWTKASTQDAAQDIHDAILDGAFDRVQSLLKSNTKAIDAVDNNGWTPLHYAAYNGHTEIAELLFQHKTKAINAVNNDEWTPLHYAAYNGHIKIVELLFQKETEAIAIAIDAVNKNGWTPLHYAAYNGHTEIVVLLFQKKTKAIDAEDNIGLTPLDCAAGNGHTEIVKLLFQKETKAIDAVDNNGWTPLHYAAYNGHTEIVELLFQKETKAIDAVNKNGWTPLHYAAGNGHTEIVELLFQKKTKAIDAEDNNGLTPLYYANENGQTEIVKLLEERMCFWERLLNLDSKKLETDLPMIVERIENVTQLKMFYTFINLLLESNQLTQTEASKIIHEALEKTVPSIASRAMYVDYTLVLDKAREDNHIDVRKRRFLDKGAANKETSTSPFVTDIRRDILFLNRRVGKLEASVDDLEDQAHNIEKNIEILGSRVQTMCKAIMKKNQVEAATSFVCMALNAVSLGVLGPVAQGAMATTMSHLVDFGDLDHIQSIVDGTNNDLLRASYAKGIQTAEEMTSQEGATMLLAAKNSHAAYEFGKQVEKLANTKSSARSNNSHMASYSNPQEPGEEASVAVVAFVAALRKKTQEQAVVVLAPAKAPAKAPSAEAPAKALPAEAPAKALPAKAPTKVPVQPPVVGGAVGERLDRLEEQFGSRGEIVLMKRVSSLEERVFGEVGEEKSKPLVDRIKDLEEQLGSA